MATLTVTSGDEEGQTLKFSSGQLVGVGRSDGNALVLADTNVSRKHASFLLSDGACVITDLGSRYGTLVNGKKVLSAVPLKHGDLVTFGSTIVEYSSGDVSKPSVPKSSKRTSRSRDSEKDPHFDQLEALYQDEVVELKMRVHENILGKMKLRDVASKDLEDDELLEKLELALDAVLKEVRHEIPSSVPIDIFRQSLMDELVGYGPITSLLNDPTISEVMVNCPERVFVERNGILTETNARFYNERHLMTIISRIVEPLGRHVDESSPMVDARLPDGSRVNAIIPPLALEGSSLTIRKFSKDKLTTADLIKYGSITEPIALFLEEAVRSRNNILVSGGTGSGKTTLLNILSQFIPAGERLVTIEDSAELKLGPRNIVRLESRPDNIEGKGRIAIRDLVINSLRMRPDRIIVGECRGPEALDMLQAMNTGHDGSLTTVHANNPRDAVMRLESLVMMAGFDLPSAAIREQISGAINLIVQQTRLADGSRKVVQISELTGREGETILMQDIFLFKQTGYKDGKVEGYFTATGNIPRFVEELKQQGNLELDINVFNQERI